MVLADFVLGLGPNVVRDCFQVLWRVEFQCLQELLEIPAVPINETPTEKRFLLYLVLLGELDCLNTLEVACVLRVYLSANKLFEPVWVREEPKLLDKLHLFLLGFV